MAGHSHWANIKHKKAAIDRKRAKIWGKIAKKLMVAAKSGSDPRDNLSLRYVIDEARAANMPRTTIENAVAKGSGEAGGDNLEEIVYEGYGPGGVAVLLEILTDNRNRTAGVDTSAGYDGDAQVEQAASTAADDTERSAVIVEYITTRADIMDDYRAAPPGRRIERLTDQQLLDVLAELGRPAGLIRISDEMRLSRDVTDNPRDRLDDGRSRGHGFSLPPSLIIPVEEA